MTFPTQNGQHQGAQPFPQAQPFSQGQPPGGQPYGLPNPPMMMNNDYSTVGQNGGIVPGHSGHQGGQNLNQRRARATSFRTEAADIERQVQRSNENLIAAQQPSPYARSNGLGDSDYELLKPRQTPRRLQPFFAYKDLNEAINLGSPPYPPQIAQYGVGEAHWRTFMDVSCHAAEFSDHPAKLTSLAVYSHNLETS